MVKVRVDGQEVSIKHTSPISRSQDLDDVMGLSRMFEIGNATIGPEAMQLGVKIENIPEYLGKKLGVDSVLLRSDAERADLMQKAQEAVAQNPEMVGGASQ